MSVQITTLPYGSDPLNVLPAWVVQHCPPQAVVLEIGAGRGEHGYPAQIKQHGAYLVGVDPDSAIVDNPYLDEKYQMTIEEFAAKHPRKFDCAYAFFVVEHVTDPVAFLTACRALLKEGGAFFALTPNLQHYFGTMAKASTALGVEDWLLRRLRGAEMIESYHFPVQYKLNDAHTIQRHALQAGFRKVELCYFDMPARFEVYLPAFLRWAPRLYARCAYALGLNRFMGFLMLKVTC